jgi:hypothetical protein
MAMTSIVAALVIAASTNIEDTAKEFVDHLTKSEFVEAGKDFDDALASVLSRPQLADAWNRQLEKNGSFSRIVSIRSERGRMRRTVSVYCQFEKGSAEIKVLFFNDDGRIGGVLFPGEKSKRQKSH